MEFMKEKYVPFNVFNKVIQLPLKLYLTSNFLYLSIFLYLCYSHLLQVMNSLLFLLIFLFVGLLVRLTFFFIYLLSTNRLKEWLVIN